MSRLTRDGTAEPVSGNRTLRRERGQGNFHFFYSADHEHGWQPYPVDSISAMCDDHTCLNHIISCRIECTNNSCTRHQKNTSVKCTQYTVHFFFLFFNLTYSRWTSSLPSCLWSLRISPSLPGSRLIFFYRDASSAILQLVNQWLDFTYSRSHALRYGRKNTNPTLVRIELKTSALAGVQITY